MPVYESTATFYPYSSRVTPKFSSNPLVPHAMQALRELGGDVLDIKQQLRVNHEILQQIRDEVSKSTHQVGANRQALQQLNQTVGTLLQQEKPSLVGSPHLSNIINGFATPMTVGTFDGWWLRAALGVSTVLVLHELYSFAQKRLGHKRQESISRDEEAAASRPATINVVAV